MGDIAEMMMEGTLCQECGGFIDDDEDGGYPRTCEDCKREAAEDEKAKKRKGRG